MSTSGSESIGAADVTADSCPPSATTSTRQTGRLKSRVPPNRPTGATYPMPPPWATPSRLPADPGQSPVCCL